MTPDPLLDRIQSCCKLSTSAGGAMPVAIIVADEAEKARGLALLKGRRGNQAIGFRTEAEAARRR